MGETNLPTINFDTRQKIVEQALQEIQFARTFKQGKIKNWKINEDLYYGRKPKGEEARANVDLGLMQSFVHTLMSKIDNPLVFKYTKRKEAQLKRVARLNALRAVDQQLNDWDMKDLVGKKQGIIYGRAIYSYYADSYNGYCAHLSAIDVYDFLIDPSAGGLDVELAMYLGNYGVVRTESELKKGIKDGIYLKTETTRLLEGSSNATEMSQEQINKQSRTTDQNVWKTQKEISDSGKYVFWNWYTTYQGKRYYLLLTEKGATAIRVAELSDVFESNLWPFWTWAAFPDLTEFWTPSYCDYVREVFMAQAVSINQLLDNAEQINKPQKIVNVTAVENLAELKYRRDGYIKVKGDTKLNDAVQFIRPDSLQTPIEVFNLLDAIQEKSSGVTGGAKGVSEDTKVGIYEGNQANAADRFGLFNKSYAHGYKRFAKLYECGVREHLTKKVAVDIIGPDGVQIEEISRRDIFRKSEEFGILVEASNAEMMLSEVEKKTKLEFLQSQALNPIQNPKKAYEISASIAGIGDEEIKQLLDTSEFGDAGLMSEAERDIELIIDGQKIKPNQAANTAYKQRFVDYMRDNDENLDTDQFKALADYVLLLDPIIARNMNRQGNQILMKNTLDAALQPNPLNPTTTTGVDNTNVVDPNNPPAPALPPALPTQ